MKELAGGLAKQQIENGSNVMELVSSLFEKENYNEAISKLLNNTVESSHENDFDDKVLLLENSRKTISDNSKDLTNGFLQFVKHQREKQR